MRPPAFVTRALRRLATSGVLIALLAGAIGFAGERSRFGADAAAARQRIEADVRAHFDRLQARLDAAGQLAVDLPSLRAAELGDVIAQRALFDLVARIGGSGATAPLALTLYGASGVPVAWSGRPNDVPAGRLAGAASMFVAPGTQGLRLVRVQPLLDPAVANARAGALVAEVPISLSAATAAQAIVLPGVRVAVRIRPRYEGVPEASSDSVIILSRAGEPLAAVEMSAASLADARAAYRREAGAAVLGIVAVLLLLGSGPLLDWRRSTRSTWLGAWLTVAIAAVLVVARWLLWLAVGAAGLADVPLAAPVTPVALSALFLRSPWDLLATSLLVAGLTALGGSGLDLWRMSRRRAAPLRVAGLGGALVFVLAQAVAGAAAFALAMAFEWLLRAGVSHGTIDILQFGLGPRDYPRLATVVALVVLAAAVAAAGVLVLRIALVVWRMAPDRIALRLLALPAWLLPGMVLTWAGAFQVWAPPLATCLAVVFMAAVAWTIGRYRRALRHASQAVRLVAYVLALALPAVVFYPSFVDAAFLARRQVVEVQFAPEVQQQRRDVQLRLTDALAQIDRIPTLPELVDSVDPPALGPPPTDAAFLVWSQTQLASLRLTSSIELYNASGTMVSRFALKLPEIGSSQMMADSSCDWELVEEVSPFFAEERRVLHAGRALCTPGPSGQQRRLGSVVAEAMLDYGNLSFISSQSPYVALLRSGRPEREPSPQAPVTLTVFGWSRQLLYASGRPAVALSDAVFQESLQSRTPFWAVAQDLSGRSVDAYVMNDRGALYVLSTPRQTAFGHMVVLAELVTLAFVVFVLAVGAGMVYGLVAARTPTSGRALLREVRASFYRKLFLAFVAAAIIPVLALAFVTRAYIAALMFADIETEASQTASVASRVVEDFASLQGRDAAGAPLLDDNVVVWLSRVIAQDVNVFEGPALLASSERNLFASGLLSTRTPGDAYRAIHLDGRPAFVGRDQVGKLAFLVAAAPLRIVDQDAILMVPLTSRQQEIEGEIEELDRRVLLAALLFIMLGAFIGYSMAERIADPVNRLMRATQRIARGDLDARVLATSSDELQRLVDAFNRMADDLQRQRAELERTNRLAAWADMARQVAHDIKNPLTPIQLNAEHLRRVHSDRGRPLGNVVDECVASILGQVRLLRQIASEFSSFAASPQPRPQPTEVRALIDEIVIPYRAGLAGRVEVVVNVAEGLPTIHVDKMLIGRALTNVIENALHAMPGGGRLVVSALASAPAAVAIAVADTGVGMDAEALRRIFEPYFSTKAIGTGLGLTIAQRNVAASGGSIVVQSQPGTGTTVTLTLNTGRAIEPV